MASLALWIGLLAFDLGFRFGVLGVLGALAFCDSVLLSGGWLVLYRGCSCCGLDALVGVDDGWVVGGLYVVSGSWCYFWCFGCLGRYVWLDVLWVGDRSRLRCWCWGFLCGFL